MKKTVILTLICAVNYCFSQIIAGKLISSEDSKPVKYAKIGFTTIDKGNVSDDNGNFTLDLTGIDKEEIVKIEIAGFQTYQNTVEKLSKVSPLIIILEPRFTDIKEVAIPMETATKNLGYNSKSKTLHIDFLPKDVLLLTKRYTAEELDKPQLEIAVPVKTKKKSKISSININFSKFDLKDPLPARFIIYTDLNGKPDQILNTEDILFQISNRDVKDGTFTFDVSNKNIWFSEKIFVSFQPLDKNFSGSFQVSAGVFGGAFARTNLENWKKIPLSLVPAINIDVKTKK